jgi:hypothetical protein
VSPRKARRRPPRAAPRDVEADFARVERARERCRSKQWFATEAEARAIALMHRTQWGEDRVPYACEHCDGWHLASRG